LQQILWSYLFVADLKGLSIICQSFSEWVIQLRVGRRRGVMSKRPSNLAKNPIVDDRGLAFTVYILYFLGYVTGITSIIGVMIAYFQDRSTNSELASHFTFQIRTFWIGFLYLVVGGILLHMGIGVLVLLWGFVWSLMRNVKGILALNRSEPIAHPNSWLFGD
jgi:uncharacterized membrane protein